MIIITTTHTILFSFICMCVGEVGYLAELTSQNDRIWQGNTIITNNTHAHGAVIKRHQHADKHAPAKGRIQLKWSSQLHLPQWDDYKAWKNHKAKTKHKIPAYNEISSMQWAYSSRSINPFMPNGIPHSYKFDQPISVLRVVGWYFSFLFKS